MIWFIYIASLIIPVTFSVIGYIFWKHAPQKINSTAGWKTKKAMKNQETWIYANHLGGKCTLILGILEIITTVIILLILTKFKNSFLSGILLVLVIIQTTAFLLIYRYVETKIKEHFLE